MVRQKYNIDEEIVTSLNLTFTNGNTPWHLRDALKSMFNEEPQLKEKYIEISESLGLKAPSSLGF